MEPLDIPGKKRKEADMAGEYSQGSVEYVQNSFQDTMHEPHELSRYWCNLELHDKVTAVSPEHHQ